MVGRAVDAADLPDDVLAFLDQHLLDLGGTYGDPEAGDPIQADELRIEYGRGDVEIVVYNRAIPPFTTESAERRIHEVCCRLDDIAGGRPPSVAFYPSGPTVRRSGCEVSPEPR